MKIGLHDLAGGRWLAAQGGRGLCVITHTVRTHPHSYDYRPLHMKGITIICRLNWGYADGTGTLPPPDKADAFVAAVRKTIRQSKGISYWHVGNEPNNRREHPAGFTLTAQYVVNLYNRIWHGIPANALLGLPPIDPYFGPGSDNRTWQEYFFDACTDVDAIFLHAKTQTNDPSEVWSRVKFGDWPLTWQYYQMRVVETSLAMIPPRLSDRPVFVTECNPQHLSKVGGKLGWGPSNKAWVREACDYLRGQGIDGVAFYRYVKAGDQAPFALEDQHEILDEILWQAKNPNTAPGDDWRPANARPGKCGIYLLKARWGGEVYEFPSVWTGLGWVTTPTCNPVAWKPLE